MRRKIAVVMVALGVLAVGAIGWYLWDVNQVQVVRIGASGKGNIAGLTSDALARIVAREHPRIRLEVVQTKGSAQNVELLQRREIDLAVVQADQPATSESRSIALLYPQAFHLIVPNSSPIKSVSDLRGKRVGTGVVGGGSETAFRTLIAHYGLGTSDFLEYANLDAEPLVARLHAGELDAIFGSDAIGEERPARALADGKHRLVAIDQVEALQLSSPFVEPLTIPVGAYRSIPPIPASDLKTVAVQTSLLASLAPAVDSEAVGVAVHEGALAYFNREKPSFLQQNAESIGLFLTITTMGLSGALAIRTMLRSRRKNRADHYLGEIVEMMQTAHDASTMDQLLDAERQLLDMFAAVMDDFDKDRMNSESVESFMMAWNQAIQVVRHREVLVLRSGGVDPRAESRGGEAQT